MSDYNFLFNDSIFTGVPSFGHSSCGKAASVVLLDMPANVHMVSPQRAATFEEYTPLHLLLCKQNHDSNTTRLDVVWDKNLMWDGQGSHPKYQYPRALNGSFLKDSVNKNELSQYFTEELSKQTVGETYHLYTTKSGTVSSNQTTANTAALSLCDQDEADTRLIIHLQHAGHEGHKIAYIRTVDTDVIILWPYHFHQLDMHEVWVGFGVGRHTETFQFITYRNNLAINDV